MTQLKISDLVIDDQPWGTIRAPAVVGAVSIADAKAFWLWATHPDRARETEKYRQFIGERRSFYVYYDESLGKWWVEIGCSRLSIETVMTVARRLGWYPTRKPAKRAYFSRSLTR